MAAAKKAAKKPVTKQRVESVRVNLIINMHNKRLGYKAIAAHYGMSRDTVRSIILRYKESGTTAHIIKQKLRRAISESVRKLLRLRKGKRYSRLRVTYKELSAYIAKRPGTWGLKKKDLPARRTLMQMIAEIPNDQRRRTARFKRTVPNCENNHCQMVSLGLSQRRW